MKTPARFAMATSAAAIALAARPAFAGGDYNMNLHFTGFPTPNTRATPTFQAFQDWCSNTTSFCPPTFQYPAFDMGTDKQKGTVYVWGAFPQQVGTIFPGSGFFSQFSILALDGGEIYIRDGANSSCTASLDPIIKPPKYSDLGAAVVMAGGSDGFIVGGTGKYKGWTGNFSYRGFFEFGETKGVVYQDQLFIRIKAKPGKGKGKGGATRRASAVAV